MKEMNTPRTHQKRDRPREAFQPLVTEMVMAIGTQVETLHDTGL